jgi:hypothetical protein
MPAPPPLPPELAPVQAEMSSMHPDVHAGVPFGLEFMVALAQVSPPRSILSHCSLAMSILPFPQTPASLAPASEAVPPAPFEPPAPEFPARGSVVLLEHRSAIIERAKALALASHTRRDSLIVLLRSKNSRDSSKAAGRAGCGAFEAPPDFTPA